MTTSKETLNNEEIFGSPFVAPTTTASDLLRITEEIQDRNRSLDNRLLVILPNLVSSYVLRSCEACARIGVRSLNIKLGCPAMVDYFPLEGKEVFDRNELTYSCRRILHRLGPMAQSILTSLGFKC
jgi:hypothetical protein